MEDKKNKKYPLIRMENIHKRFGGVVALRGVNFDLDYSEIVGLVGDNGAGKSTLIKILSGAHPPTEGTIYFEGEKVEINSPKDAKQIGIETVYQDLALAENLDVASNIFLGREFIRGGLGKFLRMIDKKKMWQEAEKVMRSLEIQIGSVKTLVQNLSGGQRQAVAIGKTVYLKPKVIIMDEPTANISVKERNKVLELIQKLKKEGISLIFISHNLHEVFSVVDRVVVLNRGEKVGDEKVENTSIDEVVKLMIGR
ncbi:MAG TPA: sugar ABC transporter ATP-binding protein [Candidatus Aerophobetes bacterium]|uniref:Sugar ABC transporter ATP-binding protein n=1 Tax=Aerophobetes bacterium TaxID=2030807 RepID=A0A662DMR6_UNCAE|nr:MAG: sugar ABC transporter ATP-binding protein [Candidatus Aerophobetes bacterium]HDN84989.1 sugar ABC transporter ATP-binding protein [Candidatus Aerophobetes bacterium]